MLPVCLRPLRSAVAYLRWARGRKPAVWQHLWRYSSSMPNPEMPVNPRPASELEHDEHPPQAGDEDSQEMQTPEEDVRLMDGLRSPWPYLSVTDEELSLLSAGEHWPWKNNLPQRMQAKWVELGVPENFAIVNDQVEKDLDGHLSVVTSLDLAAMARVASAAENAAVMAQLFERHLQGRQPRESTRDVLDRHFQVESLVSILQSVGQMQKRLRRWADADLAHLDFELRKWQAALVQQLLQRRSPRRRYALVLLASARNAKEAFQGGTDTVTKILQATSDVLQSNEDQAEPLSSSELLSAMEALVVVRELVTLEHDAMCRELASRLLQLLGNGPTLVQLLLRPPPSEALRFLAALAQLPEPLARPGRGSPCAAQCLARLSGVRYARDALVDQESAAAAAFTWSRCGAWTAGSADYLLMQALRRDMEEVEAQAEGARPRQVLDAERISAVAGSWWLASVAMSGLALDAAAGRPEEWAQRAPDALMEAIADLTAEGGTAPLARALWALHVLEKAAEKEELSQKLLQDLESSEPKSFTWETWQLLRELQPVLAEDKEDSPFTKWKDNLAASGAAEREAFLASPRKDEILTALKELGEMESEAELGFMAGPFCLPLFFSGRNVAIDIDFHHCVVSPVLRRKQWTKVAPDLEVKEISLADWDKESGAHRADLLRQFLGAETIDETEAE